MMYTEEDLLPISALQHWLFCRRQCGLIHLEQLWDENRLTAEGRLLHEKVHDADTDPSSSKTTTRQETRPGIRIVRGLRIHSYRLGLIGQADVVEFHKDEGKSEKEKGKIMESPSATAERIDSSHSFGMTSEDKHGSAQTNTDEHGNTAGGNSKGKSKKEKGRETLRCAQSDWIPGSYDKLPGNPLPASPYPHTNGASSPLADPSGSSSHLKTGWRVVPVEYKRGSPKINACDEVQLCAQAMCLEEMLKTAIPQGAFFYGKPRRRKEVEIDDALRQETEAAVKELHALIKSGVTPTARYEKKCDACSLVHQCMPKTTGVRKKVDLYLERAYAPIENNESDSSDPSDM